ICFCTIGDASTSEGHFWESVNAAAVQQIPMAIFVWDDGYGISVPKKYQTTKSSISEALSGFKKKDGTNGIDIYKVKAWDYAGMCEVFEQAIAKMRRTHTPALFHVEEVTQPQGHSTSGSHERYKTAERLAWEQEWDCIKKFKEWILSNELCDETTLQEIEEASREQVRTEKNNAWQAYQAPILAQSQQAVAALQPLLEAGGEGVTAVQEAIRNLQQSRDVLRRDILKIMGTVLDQFAGSPLAESASALYAQWRKEGHAMYERYLYNEGPKSALRVAEVKAVYNNDATQVNGYEVLNQYFDQLFARDARVVAFGEDVGYIGDVNQGFAGLQAKHGAHRIFDTGIRELTIVGQAVGLALRGLRPIAEIQYLDYLLYGLQPLSDDVATLHWRTVGQQSSPVIIRTRGHRLEGMWHSGSPMGMIVNSLRGMYVCVPRNMVQAAGMYNTLLQSNDPALVIECLNGYRLKETCPLNLDTFTVPLGVPDILRSGTDITIVSYGSTLRIVMEASITMRK
ncbi:MAG: thiamine pyrophosphate-dependent enzyme, partial [Chitinophagaceae bacterium]